MSKTEAQTKAISELAEWHGTPRPQFTTEHRKGLSVLFPSGYGFIVTPSGQVIPA